MNPYIVIDGTSGSLAARKICVSDLTGAPEKREEDKMRMEAENYVLAIHIISNKEKIVWARENDRERASDKDLETYWVWLCVWGCWTEINARKFDP